MSFDPISRRGPGPDIERKVDPHHSDLHPDRRVSFARRVTARLRRVLGRAPEENRPLQLDDVWAREEARYRAKNEGKRGA
jgi:hypothetical protein